MTETPKRRTDRLTPEQRAEVRAAVAGWPPITEAQRVQVAALFASKHRIGRPGETLWALDGAEPPGYPQK